ncbi:sigma-70 family RNA polymerase sigma factor [Bacillus subtilis]
MSECNDFSTYLKENQEKLNDPIVAYFLQDSNNLTLLQKAINNPSQENKKQLDDAFREHYVRAKIINYVSKLIYFYSIDYDKRVSVNKKRQILNCVTSEDAVSKQTERTFEEKQTDFCEVIENERLYTSFKSLNKEQKRIIELLYLYQMTNNEIAISLNMSKQLVSYYHRTALKKLKKAMIKG